MRTFILLAVSIVLSALPLRAQNHEASLLPPSQEDPAGRAELERAVRGGATAEQLFALAKIYVDERSIQGRKRALPLLRRATAMDPEFIEARLLLASLYRRYARRSAEQEYREIVRIAPNTAEAWYQLGLMAEEAFYDWRHSANRVLTPGTFLEESSDMDTIRKVAHPGNLYLYSMNAYRRQPEASYIPLMSFSREDYRDAVTAFRGAVAADPGYLDAWRRLSMLYMEAGQIDEALPLLEDAVRRFPAYKEAHLLHALCLYRLQRHGASEAAFNRAFALMTAGERRDYTFNATLEILRSRHDEMVRESSAGDLEETFDRYWAAADPLYLTEENEAKLEYWSRIASANLFFGDAINGIRGWSTDRGKTVLRLGMPASRLRLRPGIEIGELRTESKTEIWYYNTLALAFTDQYLSGNFRFSAPDAGDGSQVGLISKQVYEDFARTEMYHYTPSFRGPTIDVPVTLTRFRSLESTHPGDLEVVVSYAMPTVQPEDEEAPAHAFGIFFLNDRGARSFEQRDTFTPRENPDYHMSRIGRQGAVVRSVSVFTPPDSGILSLEWLRSEDEAVCVKRSLFHAEGLDGVPAVSDILLAQSVQQSAQYPLRRGDFGILPMPAPVFPTNAAPFIYFEVYDLGVREDGSTDFDLQITIAPVEEKSGIGGLFSSLLEAVGLSGEETLSTTTGYQTAGPNAQLYLQLDFQGREAGVYEIRITIDDHVRGKEAEQRMPLRLIE